MLFASLFLAAVCFGCSPGPADAVPIEAPCSVSDGDTIRCGDERIRLLGIDAPELPGHCRKGRVCATGDPVASREALAALVVGGDAGQQALSIKRVGRDRYGRTLGVVYAGAVNVSCAQLERGAAIYRRDWDNGGMVRADCPAVAR